MKALAWDDEPGGYMMPLANALKRYGINVEVFDSYDEFIVVCTGRDDWDFVIGDVFDGHPGETPLRLPGLSLAFTVASRNQDRPIFLLSSYLSRLPWDELELPPSVIVKSKKLAPSWMAQDILGHLRESGRYIDRKKVFLIYGRDRNAAGATGRLESMLTRAGLDVVKILGENLSTEIASGLLTKMNACAAFVAVCTPDDLHEDGTYHPRQNVILEVGIGLGLSRGLQRMTFLQKWGLTPEHRALLPSDLGGVLTIRFDSVIDDIFPALRRRLVSLGSAVEMQD